jgi:hypothetical protein
MTVSETFSDWYDRMKSAISETIGPGQQKGEELDSCVRQVMAQGHDRESAYAICNDTLKADLEKSERDELLDTAREMSKYDPQVPITYGNLVEYAGVDVKGEDELELPKSCRRCNTATRVKGSFMCPDCDPSINPDRDEYELVGSGVQEAKGESEEETEKADDQAAAPTRKVYLTPSTVDEAPSDAQVKSDDRGLYYEESVDGVDQKADPMANGHDLDPATGEGTCEKTGETITAETMQDLTEDCPHCGEALSVIDAKAETEEGETGADLFLVRPGEDEGDQYEADVLGVGVDFPESGVYIDWYLEAFPDPLDEGHVSEYGSLEDFTKASGNQVELVESVRVPVAQKLAAKAVPDNAIRIDSRDEAPEGAQVIEGDRGGLYYVPEGEEPAGDDQDLSDVDTDEDGVVQDISQLDEGDEVLLGGDPVTVQYAGADETTGDTLLGYVDEDGEEFFVYEDILCRDVTVPGAADEGSGEGEVPDDPGGAGGEEAGPEFQEGQEIESPSGEPATVAAYDEDTDVVLYETEDGEELMAPGDSFRETEEPEVSETEERLTELTGAQTVNVDDLSDQQVEALETAWEDFDEAVGVPEMAVFNLTTEPPDDVGAGAGASYTLSSRTLYLNPDGLDPESKQADFEEGFIATETVEGSMFHELAHAKHFQDVLGGDGPGSMSDLRDAELTDEQKEVVEEEVSWYASTSPTELVAEVSSGLYEGREYSDEVLEMYEELGGHEVNTQ